jgi:hypothetical protein
MHETTVRRRREVVGWALLFSVPVGVGVAAATMRMSGEGPFAPSVVAPGVAAAVGVFALVYLVARDGEPPA